MKMTAGLLLLFSAFTLALGMTQPLLQLERLFFLTDRPSLVMMISGLIDAGDIALALLVGAVSIVFPIVKLAGLTALLSADDMTINDKRRAAGWIAWLSKWSMLDVLLVAIAVFAAKTSGIATAISQPGLWFFAASTIAGAVAASLVGKIIRKRPTKNPA